MGAIDQLTKQVAKGGGIIFIGNIIGKGANFLLQILLGRVLGAEAYGLYALGLTTTGIGQSVSSLGFESGIVRFGALYRGQGDKARVKGTIISALVTSLIFSIFVSILMFLSSELIAVKIFNEPGLSRIIQIFSISIPFYALMVITASAARAFYVMQYDAGLRNIFFPITNIIFVGIIFLLGFRLSGAAFGFLISAFLSALLGLYFLWKIFPEIIASLHSIYETKKLLRFSLPLLIVSVATLFLFRIDRLMLGWLGTSSDVGIYNAATIVALQIGVVVRALSSSCAPIISDLHNRDKKKEFEQVFQLITRWGLILSLPLFLMSIFFSNNIMALFGLGFSEGKSVLIVLSVASLVMAVRGPTAPMLIMSGKQDLELFNTVVLMGMNVVLNFWLIKLYGILGAAIATGVSISVLSIVRLLEIRILLGMQPYNRKCIKPLIAGIITVLIWLFIRIGSDARFMWIVYVNVLMLAYAGALYFLGLEREDLLIIRAIKRRLGGRRRGF